MTGFITNLLESLEDDLKLVQEENSSVLDIQHKSVLVVEKAIKLMKDWIKHYRFKDSTEEVAFFRNSLPLFYSKLIYHLRLYHLETKHQGAGRKLYKKALQDELKDINLFLKKQASFRQYYNSGSNRMDKDLFTRTQPELPILTADCSLALDPEFCTTYSIILSQMLAFQQLQDHIFIELKKQDTIESLLVTPAPIKKKWQKGSFALVELGYLLHLTGAIHGNLRDTMQFLENCFDTKLGNYSRTFQKMRIRQGDRAIYLVKGIDSIYKHMDDLDAEGT